MPDLPCLLNLYGERIRLVALRSILMLAGAFWPWYFSRAGLGSNVSTWEGPPFMNRWMIRLALGAKCDGLGARGLLELGRSMARRPFSWSRLARPMTPKPVPSRWSR